MEQVITGKNQLTESANELEELLSPEETAIRDMHMFSLGPVSQQSLQESFLKRTSEELK